MDEKTPRVTIARVAVLFEAGLAVVAVVLGWLLDQPPLARLRWSFAALGWGALATLPLLLGSWSLSHLHWPPFERMERELREAIIPLFAGCSTLDLAAIALCAGVGEELLFRGVLQPVLSTATGSVGGLIGASVFFGLVHLVTRTYAALAALVGLYLGVLFLLFDNVLVPVTVHALYDFVALTYLVGEHNRRASVSGGW